MGFNTSVLEAAVDEALPMIIAVSNAYTSKSETAKDVTDKSSEKCAKLEDKLKELEALKRADKASDGDDLEFITNRIVDKKIEVRDAKKVVKNAK
eukprot:3823532-Ditylum_brightwellii.AAC.1